jgi:hypothetical protein
MSAMVESGHRRALHDTSFETSYAATATMTIYQAICVAFGVYLPLLGATTYITRPNRRRFLGAFAGGVAVAVVGVGIETLSHTLGFWRYPLVEQPYGPFALYPLVVVVFAVLALIGWRVSRRFGWHGLLSFIAVLATLGVLRDFLIAERVLGIIVFARGMATVVIDAAIWIGTVAVALIVMRLVAGSSASDLLAQRPFSFRVGLPTSAGRSMP